MKQLGELSLQEHTILKKMGMLFEMYPDATGNINDDLQAVRVDAYIKADWSVTKQMGKTILPRFKAVVFYDIVDQEAEYD